MPAPPALPGRSLPYRPDLGGVRGVAVLMVLGFHLELGLPGGYIGVDVFFVLSGYLISQIIASQLDRGTWSPRRFYTRRVRRLLPAAAITTAATLAGRPDRRVRGVAVLPEGALRAAGYERQAEAHPDDWAKGTAGADWLGSIVRTMRNTSPNTSGLDEPRPVEETLVYGLSELRRQLDRPGRRLVLTLPPPKLRADPQQAATLGTPVAEWDLPAITREEHLLLVGPIGRTFANLRRQPGGGQVEIVDLAAPLLTDEPFDGRDQTGLLYSDDNHLTEAATKRVHHGLAAELLETLE